MAHARSLGATLVAALAVVAVGCGGGGGDNGSKSSAQAPPASANTTDPSASKAAASAASARGATVKVVSSTYGRVVADGRGEAFYLFAKERARRSECYGACAQAWPPVLTKGKPRATGGANLRLVGTTRRRDGKLQVTYGGHPLYYYNGDSPGRILCQNVDEFGGKWLVVKPTGAPVT